MSRVEIHPRVYSDKPIASREDAEKLREFPEIVEIHFFNEPVPLWFDLSAVQDEKRDKAVRDISSLLAFVSMPAVQDVFEDDGERNNFVAAHEEAWPFGVNNRMRFNNIRAVQLKVDSLIKIIEDQRIKEQAVQLREGYEDRSVGREVSTSIKTLNETTQLALDILNLFAVQEENE